ncbi:MAG: hypothetical protein ACHQYP_12795 [Nitrospiria bacterium]
MSQTRKRFELPLYKPTGALRLTARRTDQEGSWTVFLEVARTLPGKVKIIPVKGGNKYDWNGKITLHLDLDEIAQLGLFLTGQTCDDCHVIYHQLDHRPKTLSIKKSGKGDLNLRASYQNQEIVLTLSSGDSFLMSKGLENLLGVLLWKTN